MSESIKFDSFFSKNCSKFRFLLKLLFWNSSSRVNAAFPPAGLNFSTTEIWFSFVITEECFWLFWQKIVQIKPFFNYVFLENVTSFLRFYVLEEVSRHYVQRPWNLFFLQVMTKISFFPPFSSLSFIILFLFSGVSFVPVSDDAHLKYFLIPSSAVKRRRTLKLGRF